MTQLAVNTPHLALRRRIPIRVLLFTGLLLLLIGYPLYLFVDMQLSGGIKNSSDARGAFKLADLKAIGAFELDPLAPSDRDIPERFRALDGKRVQLAGEIVATDSGGVMSNFDLCYSITNCCVGPAPKVQHFIKSTVLPGVRAEYCRRQVKVKGVLHVGIRRDESTGIILSVYRLDVESVEPA